MDMLIIIILLVVVIVICLCCSSSSAGFFILQSSKPATAPARAPERAGAATPASGASAPNSTSSPKKNDPDPGSDSDPDTDPDPEPTTPPPTTPPPTTPALPPVSTTAIMLNPAMSQYNHSTIYFKELTVRDNPVAGVDIWINAPIEINHNVSIPGSWGGNIKTTIDTMWNITVTYTSPDQWRQQNQWTYGWMKIETGLQSGNSVTSYASNCCSGDTQGAYYAMRAPWTAQDARSITQSNGNRKLTFRTKDFLVKISANIVGYYAGTKRDSMEINISDTLVHGTMNIATG
jgi:hypothetical protein